MRMRRLFRVATLALVALGVASAGTASARSKRLTPERSSTPTTMCRGTPVIMQGLDCPPLPARVERPEHPTPRAERPRVTARGSSTGYIAPLPRTPSLAVPQTAAPYIPPPINNPSERVMQYNQSFPLNGGLGNNPTDRDAYIRYNLNR